MNHTRQVGRHNVSVMAGHENYKYNYNYVWGDKENMFSYFGSDELNGAVKVISNGSSTSRYNTEGWFSRAMYNFDEKYFLSASYRRDASSRFHPDHRWGNAEHLGIGRHRGRQRLDKTLHGIHRQRIILKLLRNKG